MANQQRPDKKPREKGASQSKVKWRDRLGSYYSHHKLVARDSLMRLLRTPVASGMTWLVIAIALALPTGLLVMLNNLEVVSKGWDGAAQISLYVHKVVREDDSRKLANTIAKRHDVASVDFISAEQALAEYKQLSGYGDVLAQLEGNPLPAVIVVRPVEASASSQANAQAVTALFDELKALPQVEQAVIDMEWLQRLYSMMALGKRMALALGALLSLGVLLVIGNTIRLAIESRRDEIVIVKLVGATNSFVRRPFLYTGLWYGLGGGLVAWLIISISVFVLASPVAKLAGLYSSAFHLQGLGFGQVLMLWSIASLLGLMGAWLAVGKHLGAIEPR